MVEPRMKRLLLFILTLISSVALGVYLFTKPACACANIFPSRIYSFYALNPIRDRAPELAAQSFLRDQSQGRCTQADSEFCRYVLRSYPVLDWRLAARKDSRTGVVLYYRVKARRSSPGEPDEFWGQAAIEADRQATGWKITSYSAVY
jgi:hypothetical protein